MTTLGPLALVGGEEFTDGCDFDADIATAAGADTVVVLPAAAAYLDRTRHLDRARARLAAVGLQAVVLDVWDRRAAKDPGVAEELRAARMVYVLDGAAMHLRSVLHETGSLEAIVEAWRGGGALVASGAGADVLCDAMVDSRGGAFTVGLGVLTGLSVIPHHDRWSRDKIRRTIRLASADMTIAGIPDRTVLAHIDGEWIVRGVGSVQVYRAGAPASLADLASPV